MNKATVEITIPVYNEEQELKQNIEILHSFCKKHLGRYAWHITIADNASTDNTPVVGALLAKKYPTVSLFA